MSEPGYSWSPLSAADIDAWAELVNLLAEVDETHEFYSPEDLAEELEFTGADPVRDTWAVSDDTGALVAFEQLSFRSALVEGAATASATGGVHPDHRRRGIGTALLQRAQRRAVEGNAVLHPGAAVVLRADVGVQLADARSLLVEQGFVESRFFHEMQHDLHDVGDADVDAGLRAFDLGQDGAAVLEAHTEAFADHWRSAPWSSAEWADFITESRSFRPKLSFLRQSAGARVEGYVLCHEYVDGELYINLLGVRPGARGHGLGAALLHRALAAASAAGYRKAVLQVDSDNVTGAGRLYERMRFRMARSTVAGLKSTSGAS